MSYVNRVGDEIIQPESAVAARVGEYRDRVRWGPIISGVLIALATQLILSSFFGALGAGRIADSLAPITVARGIISNVSFWSTLALLLSLFLGGWVTTRACGPMNKNTALLNGAILWATTLAVSSFLLANGVWGAFGVAANNAADVLNQIQEPGATTLPQNLPRLNEEQTRLVAAATSRTLWWFVFGSLLSLAAALMGAVVGARSPRTNNNYPD